MSDQVPEQLEALPAPSDGGHALADGRPAPGRSGALPIAVVALVLALAEAAALAIVWTHPRLPPSLDDALSSAQGAAQSAASRAGDASSAVAALSQKVDGIGAAVDALQKRPEPSPVPAFDPRPLQADIGAVKTGLDGVRSDVSGLKTGLDGTRSDVSGLKTALVQVQASVAQVQASVAQASDAASAGQKAAQSAQQGEQAAQQAERSDVGGLSAKIAGVQSGLDALSARVQREGAAGRQVASLASSAERLARLQAGSVALSIGRPTGDIPNAPPALAKFAHTAPPTEASLILAFPDAMSATLRASEPDTQGRGFFRRIWIRAQSAVTVRDGDRVLLGDPAAGIVAAARSRLAAGDLDGAVSVLGALSGPAADAMDPWRSQAAALVDARAALASMMARQ